MQMKREDGQANHTIYTKYLDIHLISLLNCSPSPSPSPRLYLLILTANSSSLISHLPLSAMAYFFQAVALFVRRTQYFGPFGLFCEKFAHFLVQLLQA